MRIDPRPWLKQLRPRAHSSGFQAALAEAERLPELEDSSASALQRAASIAQTLPKGSLQTAALYVHIATLESWLARDQLGQALRHFRKAWLILQRGGKDLQRDALACWNSQLIHVQYLRDAYLCDWPRLPGTVTEQELNIGPEERNAVFFGPALHRLLVQGQRLLSSRERDTDRYNKLVAEAHRFLDQLRESQAGTELVGRSLLALGSTLQSQDMLQAALVHFQNEDPRAQEQRDESLFNQVIALCENACVALWCSQGPRNSPSFSFDREQCESMLTDALSKAKLSKQAGLSLIPLNALAAFYEHVRKDPVVAEGLYRACLDRAYTTHESSGGSGTSESEACRLPILGPTSYQVLYANSLIGYANLLAHLEWNGRPRTTESKQMATQASQLLGADVHARTLTETMSPSWRVWYAEKSRYRHDLTL
jgi:hypothetical protein